jgi:hypothetical protein
MCEFIIYLPAKNFNFNIMGSAHSEHIRPYHPGPRFAPRFAPRYGGFYPPRPAYYGVGPIYYTNAGASSVGGLLVQPQEDIETQLSRYAGRQGTIRDKTGTAIGTFVLEIAPGVLNIVTEIGGKTVNSSGSYAREGSVLRMAAFGPEHVPAELQYDGAMSVNFNETAFRLWRGGMLPIFLSWQ